MTRHRRLTIDADVTPRFTACYLRIAGDECAFLEAHTSHALPRLLSALAAQGLRPEDVRWVVVTHAHLDHAAGASALLQACPNATLLAHPRAAKNLVEPAKLIEGAIAVYGEGRFRELYGAIEPIAKERVRALEDGESFELGGAKLSAWHTYGHAYHHFIVDDPALETVYTGDTFGLVYPALQARGRFAIPSTSPTGFNGDEAVKSLAKVLSLGERTVCPTHYDAYEDSAAIAAQVRRFVERAAAWVDEAASGDESVEAMQTRFTSRWWSAIADEAPHFGREEKALLALDVELNAQGLAFAANARRAAATPATPPRR
jgi:glyoxylase-like metal-dependent hydrolase (beta-lactamase superfamily II)